ncbi:ATP-binding protein [Candidatus Electronema sp. JM]|uniref:ATP-binding protein n=1 Tax=Candidatus Electronema sp. JM TaxID=3401571 RepID=UPI003AA9A67D
MDIKELKVYVAGIIENIKNNGIYPKENNCIDYKKELNCNPENVTEDCVEVFLKNFAKDILAFSNADGGVILIGIKENKNTGIHEDIGLQDKDLNFLQKIDLNDVSQRFVKIVKTGISIDLQLFQIGTRKFYYLLIQKNNQILVPINDFVDYKITKGAIYYRDSGKTEQANSDTSEFNRFIQIKANEKSKEFMEIWSNLLPEMVDINPREILILNPLKNKIYGFNSKDKKLSESSVEIEKSENGIFNIILNAISAGEIGKITDNEGKPIYKIIGELYSDKQHIPITTLHKHTEKIVRYKFTNLQLKAVIHYPGWVDKANFIVDNPPEGTVKGGYDKFIWIETTNQLSKITKIFFSSEAIDEVAKIIDDESLHESIFKKKLSPKGD